MKVNLLAEHINSCAGADMESVMLLLLLAVSMRNSEGVMFPEENQAGTCLRGGGPVLPCAISGAVSWLEEGRGQQLRLADGLFLDHEPDQEDPPQEGDPREVGTLLAAAERSLSARRLLWRLDWLYPGLTMVVAPGSSLFFTVDGRRSLPDQAMGTGRLMIKRALLPMLLGVQLKTTALVPILVAALVLLAKKALLLSKLSLLLSGYGWLQQNHRPQHPSHYQEQWRNNASDSLWF